MNKKLRTFVYPVCAFIVLLLLWQVCVMLSTSEIAFPTPVAVFKEFFYILTHKVGNYYTVVGHVLWSLSRVLVGFSIAAVFGIILGLTMGWFDYVRAVMMPIFNLLRPIAPLAWIPLAILWFGIGEKYKYFVIFITAFVPLTLNAFAGASHVDNQLVGAARMLGASKSQLFFEIVVPAAVPSIFSGAQVALSNSWMTMLAAEMVCATEGVGWIIIAGQSVNDMTQMIAGMLAIGIVGLLLAIGMRKLEERCLIWNNQGK